VYRNGVKLGDADYTATSGTSVVLGEGAAVSDIVEIVTYDVFSVADTVSKADGGTFDGNVTMAGTLAVTGETTLATHLNMGDNDIIKLGDSADLQIYHSGTQSYISEQGTGHLNVLAENFRVRNPSDTENMLVAVPNGAVNLYYDNAIKLATTSTGIDVTGGFTATDGCTITTADNTAQLTLISTDTDASRGPILDLYRNSSSPADNDIAGTIQINARNDNSQDFQVAEINFQAVDVSDGTEDGRMNFSTMLNGTSRARITVSPTETAFNEDSRDLDFRVESDNSTHALFVQGSDGNVGIDNSSPTTKLDVDYQHTNTTVSSPANAALRLQNTNGGANNYFTALSFTTSTTGVGTDSVIASFSESAGNSALTFWTDTSNGMTEKMRIDSSGNLLVGKTVQGLTNAGFEVAPSGQASATQSAASALRLNRLTSDGEILQFRKDTSTVGIIGTTGGKLYIGSQDGSDAFLRFESNEISPCAHDGSFRDNVINLGKSASRFDDIYATNGTIQTSDRNEKQDIENLSEAETRVAVAAKGLLRKFRWQSAVEEKGDNARTHFGIIAQDLQDAFTAEGLDAGDYAMFISATWWEKEISVDAVEADEENGIEAKDAYTYIDTKDEATDGYTEKTRLGVRYSELLAFIISAI
jgi:hypothetical protein